MSNGATSTLPTGQPGPSTADFLYWIRNYMGVPANVMGDDSPFILTAYNLAISVVLSSQVSGGGLDLVPGPPTATPPPNPIDPTPTPIFNPSVYALAVYNFAADVMTRIAQDATAPPASPPPDNAPTFWSDLRTALGVNTFSYGLVQSASDQGTSTGYLIPKAIANMSLANLMQLQTPWGRQYLAIIGQWGTLWGLS